MDTRTSLTPVLGPARAVRLALVALTLAFALAPAAAVIADVAPVLAQEPSPCGDRPCSEVPVEASPCGDRPCGEVPANVSPCGDRPCGEVPANASPCGDKPCGEVPANANPCGDKPCGEANGADVNKPAEGAPAPAPAAENGEAPATTAAGQEAPENAEEAQPFDAENTGSSSSGWVLPVIFVALAALALFWVVRRNRDNVETEA